VNDILFSSFRYYTSTSNSRITVLSEWSSNCDIVILARVNGLPNSDQYDYQTGLIYRKNCLIEITFVLVCSNGSCTIDIDQLAAFIWIYFQISVNGLSCLINPIHGFMVVRSTGDLI
jgi:hypothetical protein